MISTAGTQVESAQVGSAGTRVTQVGRTRYVYDAAGQLIEKATSKLSRATAGRVTRIDTVTGSRASSGAVHRSSEQGSQWLQAAQVRAWSRTLRHRGVVTWSPSTVVVVPTCDGVASSEVAALIALGTNRLADHAVVAVDVDGDGQPMRRLLSSTGAGDLVGLAASAEAGRSRRAVEDFCDLRAAVPLASTWPAGPGALPPETVRDALWRLRRRFPTLIVDVPAECLPETTAVAVGQASRVVVVAQPGRSSWEAVTEVQEKRGVTLSANLDELTVVSICEGGEPPSHQPDVVRIPASLLHRKPDGGLIARFDDIEGAAALVELLHRLA